MQHKGRSRWLRRTLSYTLSVLAAKLLPFSLWIYIYPYRSSSEYIQDSSGKCIVKYVGSTENLENDLNKYLRTEAIIGDNNDIKLLKLNTSNHREYKKYFRSKWTYNIAYHKMKSDILDYEVRFGRIDI